MSNHRKAGIHDVRLVYIKNKIGVLDEIDPKPERQGVALPRVHDLRIGYPVLQGLIVQEIKHVLDGQRQGGTPMCRAEDRLEQIVDKLLQSALRGQQSGQVYLGHHLVPPLALLLGVRVVVLH